MYIAVDSGKFATKAAARKGDGQVKELTFRTKVDITQRGEAQGNSYLVEYGGKRYLVGEQAEAGSSTSSKAQELHRIATYTALHQLAESGEPLIVAIGCPLFLHENPQEKKKYRDFMFPEKEFKVKVNGTVKTLVIQSVVILPESSGVLYLDTKTFGDKMVGVIDIGGLNVNCCVYDKTIPVISSMFTDNLGSNVLTTGLKNKLMQVSGEDIPDYLMQSVIEDGYLQDNFSPDGKMEGTEKLIRDYKTEHINKIIGKCQEHSWNLRSMKLVFTGGTSEMLRSDILSRLPAARIFENAATSNVRGFLEFISG